MPLQRRLTDRVTVAVSGSTACRADAASTQPSRRCARTVRARTRSRAMHRAASRMTAPASSFAIAVLVLGAALGLGSYTFAYARGWAYMTDDPRACANCHVMNEQYDGWIKSSHRSVAVCNDCHVPHSLVAKYATKGTQRLLALVLLHDRPVFPSQSGRYPPAGRSRRRIAAAATSPSSTRWGRPPTPDRATSRVSGVTGPWAIWNFPRPTLPIRRGEPCPTRNQAECAGGVAVRS